ncbi:MULTISPECIES: hypothetical protein [Klebsiella pneumoniae complex]|uniref:hypothetical protein n=1 Tax=Klebsiella pneumoniae complex TaxID=3390273 RepID=UPI000E209A1A|nr:MULTISPECIES: hypothetical protein [Klebsiella]EKT8242882.1 hypothetical protein [Klebsiella oxytoca]DAQ82927.1 MAG TPA: hypothetical protein [Caudoviricetes sp.]HDS2233768.1 hypothetical protein [Klebsiella michiganensis]TXX18681.1 hypothetical protein D4M54_05705 [Klebsiella pneumoniae]HBU6145355.1 hypothetical protein [Klebsiella oxytoca]
MMGTKLVVKLALLGIVFASPFAQADLVCGGFRLHAASDGWTRVNGEKVNTQKITFLKREGDWDNIKTDMTLMPARDGNMYGYEFIKQNGKAFLNVELIRRVMEEPRIIGSFDCKRVQG